MRTERIDWLAIFCCISLVIHLGLLYKVGSFSMAIHVEEPKTAEMEVALEPLPQPPPAIPPKIQQPKPAPPERQMVERPRPQLARRTQVARAHVVHVRRSAARPIRIARNTVRTPARMDPAPGSAPGSQPATDPQPAPAMKALDEERPLAAGPIGGRRDSGAPHLDRLDRTDPAPTGPGGLPTMNALPGGRPGYANPDEHPDDLVYNGGGAGGVNLPHVAPSAGGGGRTIMSVDNPLAREGGPNEQPGFGPGLGRVQGGRIGLATLRSKPGTGIGAGRGSGAGTYAPSGGTELIAEQPGTGGIGIGYGRGEGRGFGSRKLPGGALVVDNPLAGGTTPQDRPGIGLGHGGGAFGGPLRLTSLRMIPGRGTGGGGTRSGNGIAGHGAGNGIDMPGMGGSGTGYGRGNGTGAGGRSFAANAGVFGNPLGNVGIPSERPGLGGNGPGGDGPGGPGGLGGLRRQVGYGPGGGGTGRGKGAGPGGRGTGLGAEQPGTGGGGYGRGSGGAGGDVMTPESGRTQVAKATPVDSVGDMIRVPMRGAVFGAKPAMMHGGSDGAVHIVYMLDVSDSMNLVHKLQKAKRALKVALSELEPRDTFNIIAFETKLNAFSDHMMTATRSHLRQALEFVDDIHTDDGTNLGAALDVALGLDGATHAFLLSDGEPSRGITEPARLRQRAKERNSQHIQIVCVALGNGTRRKGYLLLQELAADSGGTMNYVDLTEKRSH